MHTIWWAVWHTGWTGALCIISISWGNSPEGCNFRNLRQPQGAFQLLFAGQAAFRCKADGLSSPGYARPYQIPRRCCMPKLTAAMPTQQQAPMKMGLPPVRTSLTMFVLKPIAAMAMTIKN